MSTGPGPTRKADGTVDSSVNDISDLLVDEGTPTSQASKVEPSDDNLDVMLETPGPVLASAFLPPPPAPNGDAGDDGENTDEGGAATNLAYEDLLAKLVLPAKASEPEPQMPAVVGNLPLPEPVADPMAPPAAFGHPSQSLQVAPPGEERTLVTENPLVAEEQEAAFREGRAASREPNLVREEPRPVPVPEAVAAAAVNAAAKSKLIYLMLGGLLMLTGAVVALLVARLISPPPQPPPVVPVVVPPPPASAPAHVEPLPPSTPPGAVAPAPEANAPSGGGEVIEKPAIEPKPRRQPVHRAPRPAAPKAAATPTKVSRPTPRATPRPRPSKKPKSTGFADPFDN